MIDVTHQINAVRRPLGSRVLAAGEGHVVTLGQTYEAAVEDVWDTCTGPERLPRWLLPVANSALAARTGWRRRGRHRRAR